MTFDLPRYRQLKASYQSDWKRLDETLYAVCRQNPGHVNLDHVITKVYIIGRTYSTQIERHVRTAGGQGGALATVYTHLHCFHSEVDGFIEELSRIENVLTLKALRDVASVHGRFAQLLARISRTEQMILTSFASKYLHFHAPVVPIFDRLALAALAEGCRWNESCRPFPYEQGMDGLYVQYLARLWPLYRQVHEAGEPVTAKLIDHYVLSGGFSSAVPGT